jgi:hypothetical protein
MIMMMTDPDRVALSAFLPAFLFRFIHPFMPTSTPTFHRNVPPCNLSHILSPHRSSSSVSHRSKFVCFLPTSRQHLACMPDPPLLLTSSPFSLCAAPLSRSSISTSFAPKQPTITPKNLQSEPHSALLSLFASQHAYTHLRSIIYVSITRGGIYLAPK